MYITYKKDYLKRGVGKNVSIKISALSYSPKFQTIVAYVNLKKNFTDNLMPHVVLSKPRNMKRADIRKLLMDESFETHQLPLLYTVHGRIGLMCGSMEESASIVFSNGNTVQISNTTVSRPEVTISVDNSPPPEGACAVSEEQEEDFYNGKKVYTSQRGRRYIIYESGLRRYLTDAVYEAYKKKNQNKSASSKDVVYNINILENA
jgi:hypothetical protein